MFTYLGLFEICLQVISKDENKYSSGVSLATIVSGLYHSMENRTDKFDTYLYSNIKLCILRNACSYLYIKNGEKSHVREF